MSVSPLRRHTRRLLRLGLVLWTGTIFAACADDTQNNATPQCADGEAFNPISGMCTAVTTAQCPPGQTYDDVLAMCVGGTVDPPDMAPDSSEEQCSPGKRFNPDTGRCEAINPPDMGPEPDMEDDDMPEPDMPVDPCREEDDTDGDGLSNRCECEQGWSTTSDDTDGDGLKDNEEDADGNCAFSPGETSVKDADTDADGVNDGDEVAAGLDPLKSDSDDDGILDGIEQNSCTDPLKPDTDDDGLPDGVEDANQDGEVGTCMNRMYMPACGGIESDPCKDDTDGDGTSDGDEVQFRDCRPEDTMNLGTPQIISSMLGDYQLVIEPSATSAAATLTGATSETHVFEDTTNRYTGFVATLPAPGNTTDPGLLSDHVITTLQGAAPYATALRRSSGRRIATHDGFAATSAVVVDLPAGVALETARDEILALLAGIPTASVSHPLTTAFPGDTAATLFAYEVVSKTPGQYLIVGAFVTATDYENNLIPTGFQVDDLVGGTSLARDMETLEPDCVAYTITSRPKVDIIISLDNSGSMSDERDSLVSFAQQFTTLLDNANLDWRIGVTGVACSDIKNDMGLSTGFRDLWPMSNGGGFPPMPGVCGGLPGFPIPIPGMGGGTNGSLVGNDFVDANTPNYVSVIQQRLNSVSTSASEYPFTMGVAAIDRALPRADGVADKIRTDSSIVMIFATDENDEFFKEQLSFLPTATPDPLGAADRMTLATAAQPFINYMLQVGVEATAFGIFPPVGEACATSGQPGHEYQYVVSETGGNSGSICQQNAMGQVDISATLRTIAEATAGLSSGLRLRGIPISPTIKVELGQIASGMIVPITRSRADGFDYDPVVNRVSFYGANPPQTGDRVVLPYLRWKNSVFMCQTELDCPSRGGRRFKCVSGECR